MYIQVRLGLLTIRKSSLPSGGGGGEGGLFISNTFGGVGLIETGLGRGRGLFNLPKMVVSVLQKGLERKVEKHK